MTGKIVLLDGYSLMYRAFHGLQAPMTAPDGTPTNAVHGFMMMLMKVIEEERKVFVYGDPAQNIPGAMAKGVSEAAAQSIYDEIVDFANYAFNKAHAVCYAVVSYQTAYLKCHYPRQYMAALMTSVLDSAMKISGYIAECKDMGIQTLPPDINEAEDVFTVHGPNIRFGLAAVTVPRISSAS